MRGRCRQATDPERWPRARSPSARGEVRVQPHLLDQCRSTHKPCLGNLRGNLIPDLAYSVANTIAPKPQPFSLVDAVVFAGRPPRAPKVVPIMREKTAPPRRGTKKANSKAHATVQAPRKERLIPSVRKTQGKGCGTQSPVRRQKWANSPDRQLAQAKHGITRPPVHIEQPALASEVRGPPQQNGPEDPNRPHKQPGEYMRYEDLLAKLHNAREDNESKSVSMKCSMTKTCARAPPLLPKTLTSIRADSEASASPHGSRVWDRQQETTSRSAQRRTAPGRTPCQNRGLLSLAPARRQAQGHRARRGAGGGRPSIPGLPGLPKPFRALPTLASSQGLPGLPTSSRTSQGLSSLRASSFQPFRKKGRIRIQRLARP